MKILYPAKITEQEGSFFVEFIDLPDTFTEGATLEEALLNASEVLSGMLGFKLSNGQSIPTPSQRLEGVHYIAPDAKTQAKALATVARARKINS